MNTVLEWVKRILLYILGLFIIAFGINISKLASLGISPVSSIPRALEVITSLSLGTMIFAVYTFLVLCQLVVLRKNFKIKNVLGILVGIGFGSMVDLVGIDPNAFGHLMVNFPRPTTYFVKILYLILSIVIIGIGVYIYLKPKLVPMPAEGLAEAISQKSGLSFGDCKTIVDFSIIFIALLLQLIFCGGFSSLTSDIVIVREGTIISSICVGQIVKLIRRIFERKQKDVVS